MTFWQEYNPEKALKERLETIWKHAVIESEKELYALLKRRLTKKELKAFAMTEGGEQNGTVAEKLLVEEDKLNTLIKRAYKKINQCFDEVTKR